MSDPYTVIMELVKELGATTSATLDLLVGKGVLDAEDIKQWEKIKARHLAKLDQMQTEAQEKMNKAINEAMQKQLAAALQAHMIRMETERNQPRPRLFRRILNTIIGFYRH